MSSLKPKDSKNVFIKFFKRFLKSRYSIIVIFSSIFALFFVLLTFFHLNNSSIGNIVISYYFSLFESSKNNYLTLTVFVLLIIFSVFLYLKVRKLKKNNRIRFIFIYLINLIFSLIISTSSALLLVFLIGLAQVNLLVYKINSSPSSLGIVTSASSIAGSLKKLDSPPEVKEINKKEVSKFILYQELNTSNSNNFYRRGIINNIPNNLIINLNMPDSSLILVGNNLLITELKSEDLKQISPYLAYLMIRDYFRPRFIKSYPNLRVLGRQDFIKVQDEQIDKQVTFIDSVLSFAQTYIDQDYANVANDKAKISYNQNGLDSTVSYRDSQYTSCLSAGYYDFYFGVFRKYYPQSYCDNQRQSWDNTISQWQQNISDWKKQLNYDQNTLNEDLNIYSNIQDYRSLVASQKNSTPQEYGVTYDTNKIDIALDWTNAKSATAFLETLAHEYLHYASYISEEKTFPIYLEEGITEYYARKVIKKELGQDTNYGYPLLEKVMEAFLAKLPKNDLEDAYFTKDVNTLSYIIDKTYGNKFYENNTLSFISLFYGSSDTALKSANEIMKKIGGREILKKDLVSEPANKQLN